MANANAGQTDLAYVLESTYGTTPGGPSMKYLRNVSNGLNAERSVLASRERRADGQVAFVRHGMHRAGGPIECELSWQALKDWIRAALRYLTTSGRGITTIADASANNLTWAAADDSVTRASGSWVTDGFVVGMKIRYTGAGLNGVSPLGVWTISAVTAAKLTFEENAVVNETLASGAHVFEGEYATNGTTESSFSAERGHTDIAQYMIFTGLKINTMSFSFTPDEIPTVSFDTIGADVSISGSRLDAAIDDVDTSEPLDNYNGDFLEAGVTSAILRAMDCSLSWNRAGLEALGSDEFVDVSAGTFVVTGSVRAYFQNATLYNKFINETASSLMMMCTDPAGNRFYLYFPELKYIGGDIPVGGDDVLEINMPFQAYRDPTRGTTVEISMVPATAAA